jgi:phenylacetate-coenzyme A ligase PaaK-like adenylate-forming protein
MPLIRFELTDEVTILDEPCPCGSVFRIIADPQGRLDDIFVYPSGVSIHPHVLRSAIAQRHEIVEYQVRQTIRGADISIVAEAEIDTSLLRGNIEDALRALSLSRPSVTITRVAGLDRQATEKLKRFVPLPG